MPMVDDPAYDEFIASTTLLNRVGTRLGEDPDVHAMIPALASLLRRMLAFDEMPIYGKAINRLR